jgi:hypothetical protein
MSPLVEMQFLVENTYIAEVTPQRFSIDQVQPLNDGSGLHKVSFNVTGNFLGYTEVCATALGSNNQSEEFKCLAVSVIRESGAIDKAFTYSVAALVTVIYVNMGAALDIRTIKETIKKPYGPIIGFCSQFFIMPIVRNSFIFNIVKILIIFF